MENKTGQPEQPFVRLINVNKIYDKNVHAVFDFNLDINKREFIVFVGPSGCGKSTTLRMIAGLEDITSGEFYIDGVLANDLVSKDRDIAMVFQNYALYPNLTVFDNMAFSLKVRHFPKNEIKERVIEAAKILELEDYLDRKPKALSGGQRQRVALGRAIVRNARLFLMDEPLSNLDAKLRVQMRSEIIRLHKKLDTTTIYVTHDQTEAMTMADRIVVMKGGYVQQIGTPLEIYRYPANKFVASFIGSPAMNFALAEYESGKLTFEDGNQITLDEKSIKKHDESYQNLEKETETKIQVLENDEESPVREYLQTIEKMNSDANNQKAINALEAFKEKWAKKKAIKEYEKLKTDLAYFKEVNGGAKHKITFGIRPESIKKVEKGNGFFIKTKVKLSELLGDEYFVHFDFAGGDFLAKVESESIIKEGDEAILEFRLNRAHLFDIKTGKALD